MTAGAATLGAATLGAVVAAGVEQAAANTAAAAKTASNLARVVFFSIMRSPPRLTVRHLTAP